MTSGNSDTSTVNTAYPFKRDTGGLLVFKSNGLLVWGKSEGVLNSDRLGLEGRLERKLGEADVALWADKSTPRFVKSIDYFIAPTVGLTTLLVKNDRTELGVDGGVGGVWEKNPDLDLPTWTAPSSPASSSRTSSPPRPS